MSQPVLMNPNTGLIVLFLSAIAAAPLPVAPPSLLKQAMRHLPGFRLLDPTLDMVGGYTVEELKSFGYWPPWIATDLDRDGRPDVAAVVVKAGVTPQFGVIAVHARQPSSIQWVATLGDKPINSVTRAPARDTVMPLYCVECDANSWYRWSGRSYEAELYAVGERIAIATYERDQTLGLFARATRDSKLLFPAEPCTEAVVRRVAGSAAERWYFVETRGGDRVRGWIPASFASEIECVG